MNFVNAVAISISGFGIRRAGWKFDAALYYTRLSNSTFNEPPQLRWSDTGLAPGILCKNCPHTLTEEDLRAIDWEVA